MSDITAKSSSLRETDDIDAIRKLCLRCIAPDSCTKILHLHVLSVRYNDCFTKFRTLVRIKNVSKLVIPCKSVDHEHASAIGAISFGIVQRRPDVTGNSEKAITRRFLGVPVPSKRPKMRLRIQTCG